MPKSKHRKKKPPAKAGKPARRQSMAAVLPDQRAMEGFLASLAGRRGDDATAAAQEVMYDAWEASNRKRRVTLAHKALTISPLCADAYVLLAEETANNLDEAIELYRRGVEAGEMALGDETFEEDVGYFWGILETRPYMRARNGLAQALWHKGEREAAISHYREMLRLNPNDNQGIRHLLAAVLAESERDDELDALLAEYEEDASAAWTFTRALTAFRRGGDGDESRARLAEAVKWNHHVPDYLSGKRKTRRALPPYITAGGEDEAMHYVADFGAAWRKTSGALVWLEEVLPSLAVDTDR